VQNSPILHGLLTAKLGKTRVDADQLRTKQGRILSFDSALSWFDDGVFTVAWPVVVSKLKL
jgi:hypothetical protein